VAQCTKTAKNIPNNPKMTQRPENVPSGLKIFLMAGIHTNIFHSTALQNEPKLGFGMKIYHLATLRQGRILRIFIYGHTQFKGEYRGANFCP
jgi:hypothetical protein